MNPPTPTTLFAILLLNEFAGGPKDEIINVHAYEEGLRETYGPAQRGVEGFYPLHGGSEKIWTYVEIGGISRSTCEIGGIPRVGQIFAIFQIFNIFGIFAIFKIFVIFAIFKIFVIIEIFAI